MRVEVKAEHIESGEKYDECGCPIALAIKEGGAWDVSVNPLRATVYTRDYDEAVRYYLPKKARDFIRDFDRDFEVHPFTFEMEEEEG